jgi:hypothetical protein
MARCVIIPGPPQHLPRFFASQEEEEQQLQVACKRILVSTLSVSIHLTCGVVSGNISHQQEALQCCADAATAQYY